MARLNRDQKRIRAAQMLANANKPKPEKPDDFKSGVWMSPSGLLYYVNKRGIALPFVALSADD